MTGRDPQAQSPKNAGSTNPGTRPVDGGLAVGAADYDAIADPGVRLTGRAALRAWLDDCFGLDIRTLAVVRILIAVALLGNLWLFWQDAAAFFSDQGVYPRGYWIERTTNKYMASIHLMGGHPGWIHALFVVKAVFGLMLLVGWRTRLATFASWALYLSLINRNVVLSHAGDSLLLLILLWGLFVPWGARFSVDGALNTAREGMAKHVTSLGTAALLLQMPLAYFFSVFAKLDDDSWHTDFSATYYALAPEFVTPLGRLFMSMEPVRLAQGLTLFTLFWEVVGPVIAIVPGLLLVNRGLRMRAVFLGRTVAFLGITSMQVGLLLTMSIGFFPVISTAALLPLLHPEVWRRLGQRPRVQRAGRLVLVHDADCGFCRRVALLLREFLLPSTATVRSSREDPEAEAIIRRRNAWVVRDGEGQCHVGHDGVICVVAHSPVLFWLAPLLRLSEAKRLGHAVYRRIAARRPQLSRLAAPLVERPYTTRLPWVLSLCAFVLVAYMPFSFLFGIRAMELPSELRQAQYAFRLSQSWRMFRRPIRWVSYYVIEATLADGRKVDLFGGRGRIHPEAAKPLTWDPPEVMQASSFWANFRWRRYLSSYRQQDHQGYRLYYGRYICRTWNGVHEGDDRVQRFRVYRVVLTRDFMTQPFVEEPERRLLWRHWCFDRPADDRDEPDRPAPEISADESPGEEAADEDAGQPRSLDRSTVPPPVRVTPLRRDTLPARPGGGGQDEASEDR